MAQKYIQITKAYLKMSSVLYPFRSICKNDTSTTTIH